MGNTLEYILKKYNVEEINRRVEIPGMSRDMLAELFSELGFNEGAEIGVEKGYYSEVLCKTNPNLKLHCIDPWITYKDYKDYKRQEHMDSLYEKSLNRLKDLNCNIIKKTSMEAVKDFEDASLDFVYIDANHIFEYVVNDIIEWTKKVRPGGIVSGHDYFEAPRRGKPIGVVPALHGYLNAKHIEPLFIVGRWTAPPPETRDKRRSWFFIRPEEV